jgi:AraC family transcriptional regulator, transcriptional activator of pobA
MRNPGVMRSVWRVPPWAASGGPLESAATVPNVGQTRTRMNPTKAIPIFHEINACHEATGFPLRTDLPEFHVFTLEETYPAARQAMPPYRRGFYQLTFFEALGDATMTLESSSFAGAENVLIFSPPEQVLSWVCGGNERGFMLYFKPELFTEPGTAVEDRFPFFRSGSLNVLPLAPGDRAGLRAQFERLHAVYHSAQAYRRPQLAALTTALLYDCRALFDKHGGGIGEVIEPSHLVLRFRQMVARCFQEHCNVEGFARCLNVSPDHLSATVKKHTGRTPREIIDERVLLEAKRLLIHTDLTVSEIADHLQFSEPTHFTRFFKRHTECTPLAFRRERLGWTAAEPTLVVTG